MENNYLSEKEGIKGITDCDQKGTAKEDIIFRIEAKAKYMMYTNFGGIIFGILLLYILLSIRKSYSIILFIVGIFIIVLYMVIDYLIWQKKGIRVIEIDANGINFYKGKDRKLFRVEKSQITEINFFSKLGRRVINIILIGGKVVHITPWITLFFGPRIRFTDDAFNDNQFTNFVEKLRQLK